MAWQNLREDLENEFSALSSCLDTRPGEMPYALVNSKEARWAKTTKSCTVEGGKSFKDRYHADLANYREKGQARHKAWCEREKAKRQANPKHDKKTWKISKEDKIWAATCGLPVREVVEKLGVVRSYVHRLRAEHKKLAEQVGNDTTP